MTSDTSSVGTSPTPSIPAAKAPRVYSAQDQNKADLITGALQFITKVSADEEIRRFIRARGYDDAALSVGLELQSGGQSAYDTRQKAPGTKAEAKKLRDEAAALAEEFFSDYRQTAQKIPKFTAADRTTLGVDGKVPKDLQKFVTLATASYQAAQKSPYTELLSIRSYDVARLNNAIAGLKTLVNYDNAFTGARAIAKGDTSARDAAVDALNTWMSEFRVNVKLALKKHPVLLAKLGL